MGSAEKPSAAPGVEEIEYSPGMARAHCSVDGHPFTVTVVSGKVTGTDQRSDTRVSGSGYTSAVYGQGGWVTGGGGSSIVSSSVTVVRDIFFKDDVAGEEHHIRLQGDIPTRVDHSVSLISLQADWLTAPYLQIGLYNSTLKSYHEISNPVYYQKLFPYPFPKNVSRGWAIVALWPALLFFLYAFMGLMMGQQFIAPLFFWEPILILLGVVFSIPMYRWRKFRKRVKIYQREQRKAAEFCSKIQPVAAQVLAEFEVRRPSE